MFEIDSKVLVAEVEAISVLRSGWKEGRGQLVACSARRRVERLTELLLGGLWSWSEEVSGF